MQVDEFFGQKMDARNDHYVAEVDGTRKPWKLVVRLSRVCKVYNFEDEKELQSMDIIFIDAKGDQIQGIITGNYISKYMQALQEGNICKLQNFSVGVAKSNYKPVDHGFKLYFKWDTILKVLDDHSTDIPKYKFNLVPFNNLHIHHGQKDYSIDVMGILHSVCEIQEPSGNISKKREIYLQDEGGKKIRVTLWRNKANEIENDNISSSTPAPVFIITSVVVNLFNDIYCVSSTSSTRIYSNLEIPETQPLLQITRSQQKQISFLSNYSIVDYMSENCSNTYQKTLQEIIDAVKTDKPVGAVFTCQCTITGVIHDREPFYLSCGKCSKKVTNRITGKWCEKCNRVVTNIVARYYVRIDVRDPTIESQQLVIFGSEAEKLISVPIEDLVAMNDQDGGPQMIKEILNEKLIGLSLSFELKISQFNLNNPNAALTANRIFQTHDADKVCESSIKKQKLIVEDTTLEASTPTPKSYPKSGRKSNRQKKPSYKKKIG